MRKSKFTEKQIIEVLKSIESGAPAVRLSLRLCVKQVLVKVSTMRGSVNTMAWRRAI